jgi:hypothetical protein
VNNKAEPKKKQQKFLSGIISEKVEKVDNQKLFSSAQNKNQLFLSVGRLYKMGDHGPDMNALESGTYCKFSKLLYKKKILHN